MHLTLELSQKIVTLRLKKNSRIIDIFSWSENSDLSKALIENVDSFLRKNKVDKKSVSKITFTTKDKKALTSNRIIRAFVKTYSSIIFI